ncbi:hypothetical protein RQP53_02385 [Paucibacter sp. APW11]|uniref:TonB-dependent receptor plug domain-containing protein n=1 Tax=Roseateles aquae TaxID=3077235 RepID=A0ABU3P6B6_9BURK|nr:hypothetical protein [Paucibacter sp. APW11]MDT8998117.1 hypothetical protein [Paucibacter sp. APW11]
MNTVYCYDRFARLKRVGLALGVIAGMAAGSLIGLQARAAEASARIERLPAVTVTGHSQAKVLERLPVVVVTAQRQTGALAQNAVKSGLGVRSLAQP